MYQVTYMTFNEYGGHVQHMLTGKAKSHSDAKRKCLNFDSAAWDLNIKKLS